MVVGFPEIAVNSTNAHVASADFPSRSLTNRKSFCRKFAATKSTGALRHERESRHGKCAPISRYRVIVPPNCSLPSSPMFFSPGPSKRRGERPSGRSRSVLWRLPQIGSLGRAPFSSSIAVHLKRGAFTSRRICCLDLDRPAGATDTVYVVIFVARRRTREGVRATLVDF